MAAEGEDRDVIITSRIRLARNVNDFPFKARLSTDECRRLQEHVHEKLSPLRFADDQVYVDLEEVDLLDRELLLESHLISMELARADGPRGVVYSRRRHLSIMVNEEDHLRVQLLGPGQTLSEILREIEQIDQAISENVDYAAHSRFGYLTSCPTNVGTGLRFSVMLHLPALVTTKEIDKEFNAAQKMKLAVRGFYGEGASFVGDFFQVSNQVTLGRSVEDLLQDLLKVVPEIVKHERSVRSLILKDHRNEIEDKVYRALGLLRHARKISSQEALELLSQLRLGVCVGMVDTVDLKSINELLVLTQPAHVQAMETKDLSEEERDVARARYVRQRLGAE